MLSPHATEVISLLTKAYENSKVIGISGTSTGEEGERVEYGGPRTSNAEQGGRIDLDSSDNDEDNN